MQGLPSGAVVSFWFRQHDTSPDNFACSGVFVGSKHILTVKHVFQDHPALWVRPYGAMGQDYPVMNSPALHPRLDAALVDIEVMPSGCVPAGLDIDSTLPLPGQNLFQINGFFDGKYELPHDSTWLTFEGDDSMHRLSTRQPKGHSGSGLSRAGLLWGMAICHYSDPSIHRGCALSIDQLWDGWLEKHLPGSRLQRQHNAGWQEQMIQEEVGNGRLEEARKLMLRLVDNFPQTDEKKKSATISYHLSEFEDIKKNRPRPLSAAERRERAKWISDMLDLAAGIVQRLSSGVKGNGNV